METKYIDFFNKLKNKLPELEILHMDEERLIYAHAVCPFEYKWMLQGPYPYLPDSIIIPSTTQEISEIMKIANEFSVGIIPYGGGSGSVGGTIAHNQEVMIDVKKLRGIEINPINCTAMAGAGIIGAEFENTLNEAGFTAGQYPQSYHSAVLGGMVATRAIGTFSTKYGKMDDMVNSLEVVLPDGRIIKTHTAPKSSTGPELDQLFLGSEGVYGIVTKVEMKIYPIAEMVRYFEAYTFPTTLQGLEAIRQFVQKGVHPAVVRLYDHIESIPKINKYRYEQGYSLLIMGYENLKEQVEVEKKVVYDTCTLNKGSSKGTEAGDQWFGSRFSTKKIQDHHAIKGGTSDAIEVAAPWDCIGKVWQEMRTALEPLAKEVECHFSHVYHTGASVYVIFHSLTEGDDVAGEERYLECARTAIEVSLKNGGNISHHHGVGKLKAEYLQEEHGEAGVDIMKKIKNALDPQGLLNKGVLGL